jgi:hypothetical protein
MATADNNDFFIERLPLDEWAFDLISAMPTQSQKRYNADFTAML